jgi:hypothetical protein
VSARSRRAISAASATTAAGEVSRRATASPRTSHACSERSGDEDDGEGDDEDDGEGGDGGDEDGVRVIVPLPGAR